MNIDDIMRFFSAAADGQRMTDQPMGDMNQMPKGILYQPSAPMAPPVQQAQTSQVPRFAPGGIEKRRQALSPLESVMMPPQGLVASVEAGGGMDSQNNSMQMAMNPTDQRLQDGTQRPPMAPQAPDRGFFDKFFNNQDENGNSAFMHAMRGLGAAGSQDPMKAMAQFAHQDNEAAKNKAQIAQHMQPKVTHVPGTAYFQTTYPNGTTKLTENPELAKSLGDKTDARVNEALQRIVLTGQVTQANQQAQGDNKGAGEARTSLNNVDMRLDSAKQALEAIAPVQKGADGKPLVDDQGMPIRKVVLGMKDQLAAGFPGISGALGVDSVPILKQLADVRVDASAVKVAAAKGAVSDFESKLYLSPAPLLTDNYEKVWLPWIQNQIKVGEKLKGHYQEAISRDQAPGANLPTRAEVTQQYASPTAPTAPAAKAPMTIPGLSPRANKYFN